MTIVIKRYRNRKLYNTQTKRYITLEEIETLIKEQQDITVIENDTGIDITAVTLSQIIFELEKNQSGIFPIDFLQSLVRSSGKRFEDIRRSIFTSLNFNRHFDFELERRIKQLMINGELSEDEGQLLLEKFISLSSKQENLLDSLDGKVQALLREQQVPSRDELKTLMDRLDELSQMVDTLSSKQELSETNKK
jgi:polyhydroxyalkanoate synthesis repressor PhaR